MLAALPLLLLAPPAEAPGGAVTRTVGKVTIVAETDRAYPGGLLVVRLHSKRYLGTTYAIFEGRRSPFFDSPRGARALVPIPVTSPPGTSTLGIEIWARRGRQRVAVDVPVASREYASRTVVIPPEKREMVRRFEALRDGRVLLAALRTTTREARWMGPFRPPVEAPALPTFGTPLTHIGGSPVEGTMDSIFGEYHRGADFDVPPGTSFQAPAAGAVVLARTLALTGQTLVLDHGQGVVSAFYHLSRMDVREGDAVEGRAPLGLTGDSGLALAPHLHWGVYVHGVAVDPAAVQAALD